ncbi:RTM1 [Colletotrichum tamarilloi]|uniref:RTM1 n=1 Tax=Colletotrichum tamarilloi TaxID=1209934 RepID=A0ABQ9QV90_9PEZI|nr:RTM1 [Colletotrichum tamarilloi]KAK1486271.1 RTM1 [Colletotrichum tamarilloi]
MPTLESYNGYYLWHYVPSLVAAIIFEVLFVLATLFHAYKIARTKTWFCIVFVISQHTHFLAPPCFWHPQKRENPPQPNAHPQPPFITTFSIRVQMGSSFAHVFFYI